MCKDCNCDKKRCYNCKFYQMRTSKGLFGHIHKYWVCDNPETYQQQGETWWADGNKVALGEGYIQELLVGCNFGCVNWKENEDD